MIYTLTKRVKNKGILRIATIFKMYDVSIYGPYVDTNNINREYRDVSQ